MLRFALPKRNYITSTRSSTAAQRAIYSRLTGHYSRYLSAKTADADAPPKGIPYDKLTVGIPKEIYLERKAKKSNQYDNNDKSDSNEKEGTNHILSESYLLRKKEALKSMLQDSMVDFLFVMKPEPSNDLSFNETEEDTNSNQQSENKKKHDFM